MGNDKPIIIIGSGPAGVSAAFPLVQSGLEVLMLEGGGQFDELISNSRPSLSTMRTSPDDKTSSLLLGPQNRAIEKSDFLSPKFRVAAPVGFIETYRRKLDLRFEDFQPIGGSALGGLSNLWGATCAEYDESEFGIKEVFKELYDSYAKISKRIGISGTFEDPLTNYLGNRSVLQRPYPMSHIAARLFSQRDKVYGTDFLIGRSRLALITERLGHRPSCIGCQCCMYGCHQESIYNSAYDVAALRRYPNFSLRKCAYVEKIESSPSSACAILETRERIEGSKILVAAGVISTTKLILDLLNLYGKACPLRTNPAFSFAVYVPGHFGKGLTNDGIGLSQLFFVQRLEENTINLFGMLYDAGSFPVTDILQHLPFSTYGNRKILRSMAPSIMVGMAYLPGNLSSTSISLSRSGAIKIETAKPILAQALQKGIVRELRKSFRKLKSFLLPGSLKMFAPGAEAHYAGTLPIGEHVNIDGSLCRYGNVHVVDASCFQTLSEKPHTYTAMANADRIGRTIARESQMS